MGTINGAGLQGVTYGASIIAQGPSVGPTPPPSWGTDGAAVFAQVPSWGSSPYIAGAPMEQL